VWTVGCAVGFVAAFVLAIVVWPFSRSPYPTALAAGLIGALFVGSLGSAIVSRSRLVRGAWIVGSLIGLAGATPTECGANGRTVCENILGIEVPFRTAILAPGVAAGTLAATVLAAAAWVVGPRRRRATSVS
jgi:hypothetical protein